MWCSFVPLRSFVSDINESFSPFSILPHLTLLYQSIKKIRNEWTESWAPLLWLLTFSNKFISMEFYLVRCRLPQNWNFLFYFFRLVYCLNIFILFSVWKCEQQQRRERQTILKVTRVQFFLGRMKIFRILWSVPH